VGEQTVGEHLQGVVDAMLEPFADVATLAEAALAWQAAREHQTPIVFEGEAMDSLMCGSYKFIAERYRKLLNPLLSLLPRESLVDENRGSRSGSLSLKLSQLRSVLQGGTPVERHFRFNFNERKGIDLDPQVKARVWDVYKWYYDLLPDADTLTRLSCMTFFNIRGNRKLRLIERYADVRFELVYQDLDFVRLAFALPASRKVSWGYGKRIVREAFSEVVPRAVKGRAKLSFTFPVLDYFSEREIRDLCETRLGEDAAITRAVEEHRSGTADHLPFLWGLYVANQWARRYEEAATGSSLGGSSL
jgi:asparagine synthase (glutamine-hydrolysing)